MHRMTLQKSSHRSLGARLFLLLACLIGIGGMAGTTIAQARPAAPPAASSPVPTLTPSQATTAIRVLNDPAQRAHLEDTLRAIAAAGVLATPASAPGAASAPAASGAAAASTPLATALRRNGLVLQIADHAAHSARQMGARLLHTRTALLNVGSARAWWHQELHTPQGRTMLLALLRVLLLTVAPALVLEALVRRGIARPRRSIVRHAAVASGEAAQEADAAAVEAARSASADLQDAATQQEEVHRPASPAAAADSVPEAVADAKAQAATVPTPGAQPAAPAPATTADADTPTKAARLRKRTAQHWNLLRRLPAALLLLLLELVPVLAFGLCAAGVLSLFSPANPATATSVGALVDAYVICRVVITFGKLLFAPDAEPLRLMPLSNHSARFAQRWTARIVVIGGIGGAVSAAVPLGLTEDAHLALVKVIALIGHLGIAVMIVQCRRPVGAAIRSAATGRRSLEYLAHWLADIWAGVAVFAVMALWLVWALDVRGGYRDLLRAGGLSLLVLLIARVVAIATLGALGRLFDPQGKREEMSIARRRAYRYYPWLRRIAMLVIGLVTFDVLLNIWGLHPGRIFVTTSIGHLLGSALATIAVAILVAIVIWEIANGAAERRLQSWTEAGDTVRAARLRTLLPMFRTSLFVAILVVVGLTALSQLGVNTAPLIAGASIFGVALGFGSQKLVQDFITGIFLLTENAMQVGDWVTVAGVSGSVEFLSIRTVRLRGGDGSLYTVPFSSVTTVNNSNRGVGNATVQVVVAYGEDVERAVQTLKDIGAELRADENFKDGVINDFAYWGVDQVDGAGVTLVGRMPCLDTARWPVQREFNRRILERFTERGIALANPQRNFVIGLPQDATDVEGRRPKDEKDVEGREPPEAGEVEAAPAPKPE